jgi:hypothetical protein
MNGGQGEVNQGMESLINLINNWNNGEKFI